MLNINNSWNIRNIKIIQFVVLLIINLVQSHEAPSSTTSSPSLTNLDNLLEDVVKEFDKIFIHSKRACKLHIQNDTINPQPLLIQPGTTNFYNPNPNGFIEIQFGRSIELSCNNEFGGKFSDDDRTKILATCIGDKTFLTNGKQFQFSDFICDKWSTAIARRTNFKCHNGLAKLIEIGFELNDENSRLRKKRFLKIAEVCHNEYLESTLYVYHKLNPASYNQQHSIPRISFRKGDFYNYTNVDKMYKQKTQIETIGNIINDGKHHEKYFNEKKSLFLARGHLSAKSDHIYGSQQRATFYYINAAPQWQIFNAGNWQTIEDSVKNFVGKQKINVDCYTGTWGISTLPDSYGKHHKLYLHIDENGIGRIPVPKLYYRVVIEPKTKRGIVLIGVNNPHLTIDEIENDYIICDDISDLITWINWDKKNIQLGYSYACEVSEFVRVVDHLPYLDVIDILY